MSSDEKLIQQVRYILTRRSKKSLKLSKQAVLEELIKDETLRSALSYFVEEFWCDAAHPTLLSLACEAVGGNPETVVDVGAALALLTGAADIHDDIIDRSEMKASKPTVYGKFGKDIAIIAADVLWIKGMLMLNEACERFPPNKRRKILKIAKQAFFDIGSAEAKEASLRGKIDINPDELELIKLKVSVGTAAAQIGAIIGNGSAQQIENLKEYGKTLGILTTIREDFINMFEPDELKNRFKNECLPLPILCAFQDPDLKQKILGLLEKNEITEPELDEVLEKVYQNPKVRELGNYMKVSVAEIGRNLPYKKKPQGELLQLLKFTLQDLPT